MRFFRQLFCRHLWGWRFSSNRIHHGKLQYLWDCTKCGKKYWAYYGRNPYA
jgi:hypothetical protein